jgi:Putative Ig domain
MPKFSITDGALPNGLTLDKSSGEISGIPTGLGTFNFTISAVSGLCCKSHDYTINIPGRLSRN